MTTTRVFHDGRLEGTIAKITSCTLGLSTEVVDRFRLDLDDSFYGRRSVVVRDTVLPSLDFAVGDRVSLQGYHAHVNSKTGSAEPCGGLPVVDGISAVENKTTGQTYSISELYNERARKLLDNHIGESP